ncbi:uncharacterized protein K02A2.6-like [Patiria miniata]|uniref:Endonuclease n=1 Tax=Patiria miniata TaxID=46514 RepID=A0A914A4Z6_PATMI|nr:uncharacterized protein K02A2.6-like [Patiria miniata]
MSQSQGAPYSSALIGRLDPYDQVEEITNYLERLDLYFKANDISPAKQSAVLLSCIGANVYKTVKSLSEPVAVTEKTYAELCTLLKSHYGPKRLVIAERFRFYQRNQNAGETVAQYSVELQTLAGPCKFGSFLDDALRDRLVCGIRSLFIQKHLLTKDGLTFSKAIELAKTLETATKDQQDIKAQGDSNTTTVQAVHQVQQRQKQRSNKPPMRRDQRSSYPRLSGPLCQNCGYASTHRTCPAKGQHCKSCNKIGHFSKVCRSRPKQMRAVLQTDPEQEDETCTFAENEFFVGAIRRQQLPIDDTVSFLLDTGSEVNILPLDIFNALNVPDKTLQPSSTRLTGFFGGKATPIGQTRLICQVKGKTQSLLFLILPQGEPVIGKHACDSLGLVHRVYTLLSHESVFEGGGCLHGQAVSIKVDEATTPYCVMTPRRIPIPLMPKLKEELERMEQQNIIQRITDPTDWCSPIVIAPKKNGDIRLCVDLRRLNKAVVRERYTIPTVEEVLGKVAGAQIFSLLDAKHGFWQVPLTEESQKFTTFITPFGRYCFKRLPFGITSAPEIYQRIMCDLLTDIPGVVVYMDDVLITGRTKEEHDERLQRILEIVQNAGLQLNKDKCKIAQTKVDFFGMKLDKDGIHADPAKIAAIIQMPPPTTKTEVKRLMGMINWLARFIPHVSSVAAPINDLLKSDVSWVWGSPQQSAFRSIKTLLTSAPALAFYDPNKPTMVSADASEYGLGGCILQQQDDKQWKPVAYCSRSLTPSERRYAQIEKELLASVWSCERFYVYLRGLHVTIQTDHKPLVPLINNKDLCDAPLRCQRLLMRLMKYHCTAEYVPGKLLTVADTLSRAPLKSSVTERDNLPDEVEAHVHMVTSHWPVSQGKLDEIKRETALDEVLVQVASHIRSGWPKYSRDIESTTVKLYWENQDNLSFVQGILTHGDRIVIPANMRQEMLLRIHEGHQGISKSRARAAQAVWWPGIGSDIAQYIEKCSFCQTKQSAQRAEPLISTPLPERPWQRLACDLAEVNGRHYIVLVDYFSRWIEVHHLPTTTSLAVINFLKATFARFGIPEVIVTDNGPQFLTEFNQFASEYDIQHLTSSPNYPQANGMAEKAVHIAKSMLRQPDPLRALLTYRSTPIPGLNLSPARLLMGRELRTTLPTLPRNLRPKVINTHQLKAADKQRKAKSESYFNEKHGVRHLCELKPGDTVRIRNKTHLSPLGEVVRKAGPPRSYIVNVQGVEYRRNRRHLLLIPEPEPVLEVQTPPDPIHPQNPKPTTTVRPRRTGKPPRWHQDYVVY